MVKIEDGNNDDNGEIFIYELVKLMSRDGLVNMVTIYGLKDRNSIPERERDFSLHNHCVYLQSETHPASYPMGTRDVFSGVKRPKREVDHSSPSSSEAKVRGAIPPLTNTSSWRGLIKHKDNLNVTDKSEEDTHSSFSSICTEKRTKIVKNENLLRDYDDSSDVGEIFTFECLRIWKTYFFSSIWLEEWMKIIEK
jgi:hypothetical protein